jgi:hypothetical protein
MITFTVELHNGLSHKGSVQRLAELRAPNGRDEALFAESQHLLLGEQVTRLLSELVLRIGSCEGPGKDKIACLSMGDRERLLLSVTAQLLGNEIDLVTACGGCKTVMEVPVALDQLIAVPPTVLEAAFQFESETGRWSATCRPLAAADLAQASRRDVLLAAVEQLANPAGQTVPPHDLPIDCEDALESALASLDPAAECSVALTCPSCDTEITALIDASTLLRTAFGNSQTLYHDIYRMARSYHWSEHDILALPLQRRRRYLALAEAEGARP